MRLLILAAGLLLLGAQKKCNRPSNASSQCFRGRLEIKANCMNYTIRLLEGSIDPSLISDKWTNEATGKSYEKVFALGSRCSFPPDIKEGDDFYFTLDSTMVQNCAVCLIYYPTPPKSLRIKVLSGPCEKNQ